MVFRRREVYEIVGLARIRVTHARQYGGVGLADVNLAGHLGDVAVVAAVRAVGPVGHGLIGCGIDHHDFDQGGPACRASQEMDSVVGQALEDVILQVGPH